MQRLGSVHYLLLVRPARPHGIRTKRPKGRMTMTTMERERDRTRAATCAKARGAIEHLLLLFWTGGIETRSHALPATARRSSTGRQQRLLSPSCCSFAGSGFSTCASIGRVRCGSGRRGFLRFDFECLFCVSYFKNISKRGSVPMQQQRHGALKVQAKSPRAHLDILDVSLSIYHAQPTKMP